MLFHSRRSEGSLKTTSSRRQQDNDISHDKISTLKFNFELQYKEIGRHVNQSPLKQWRASLILSDADLTVRNANAGCTISIYTDRTN